MYRVAPTSIETAYSWWLAALTLVIASIGFGAATSVPILLKPMAQDWNVNTATLALVHMSTLVGAGLGSLVFGRLHDRIGFFPLALIGSLATATGLAVASLSSDILGLYLAFGLLVGACGQGVFFSPLTAALSQWFDRHQPLAIAIAASGQGLGGLLLPPLLRMAARDHGWRPTLLTLGLGGGLVMLACAMAFRKRPPTALQQPLSRMRCQGISTQQATARSAAMRLSISLGLSQVATFLVMGHITAAGEELGAAPATAAALVSVMLGASLATRLGTAQLGTRLGHYRMVVAATSLQVLGVLWISLSSGYMGIASGAALMGVGFGSYLPGYAVLARTLFPANQAGRRIAEMYFFGFLAGGAGSWVGGLLRDVSGDYGLAFRIAALIAVTGLASLLWQWRVLNKF